MDEFKYAWICGWGALYDAQISASAALWESKAEAFGLALQVVELDPWKLSGGLEAVCMPRPTSHAIGRCLRIMDKAMKATSSGLADEPDTDPEALADLMEEMGHVRAAIEAYPRLCALLLYLANGGELLRHEIVGEAGAGGVVH